MKTLAIFMLLAVLALSWAAPALVVVPAGPVRPTLASQLGCPTPARTYPIGPLAGSRISGQVSHRGEPLPGVVIAVCPAQGSESARAVTDGRGHFVLPSLAPGRYAGVVCLGGFDTAAFELTSPESPLEGTLTLELPLSPIRME
jgi:hypothetical protein